MIPAACISVAADAYDVPRTIIEKVIAVARSSAGNGAIGVMKIPPEWLPILARIGFSVDEVKSDDCRNVLAGTWVIAFNRIARPAAASAAAVPALASVEAVARRIGVASSCVMAAADFYHLPHPLVTAILATEGGHVGQVSRNANGSYDMGPAQVNSSWLPTLARSGITRDQVLNNGCLNVAIGAWILAQSMDGASTADPAEFWRHVGDYNSHTPQLNVTYQRRVWAQLQRQTP